MKREILFRGKLIDNDEWVYGDYVRIKDGKKEHHYIYGQGEIKAESVGEYSGMNDRYNNRIFEGDIVELDSMINAESGKFNAVFNEGRFCIEVPDNIDETKKYYSPIKVYKKRRFKVIGNIFDGTKADKK